MKTTISSATESVGKALKAGQKVYSEMSLLLDQTVEDGINGSEDTADTLVKAAKTVDKKHQVIYDTPGSSDQAFGKTSGNRFLNRTYD